MTTITTLPTAPSRDDPITFSSRADAFVAALPAFGAQANALASEVNAWASSASSSAAIAIASANFKGAWSSLTGALAVPASVLHSSQLWLLVSNIADVTAHTPGVSASWIDLDNLTSAARLSTPRSIALSGKITGTATAFDGTANISIPVTATNSIGDGQTWQDVSSSRSLGTTYTNSTNRPIMVSVTLALTEGVYSISDCIVDELLIAVYESSGSGLKIPFSFVVQSGSTYRITNVTSNISISSWCELR